MRERKIRQEQKRKEEAEFQEMRQEINEKMKKERIEYELKEQREEARRQLEKNRLRGESYGDMSGDLKTSLHNADVKAEQRRVNDTVERQQAQRQQRQYAKNQEHTHGGWTSGIARAPEIPKQKVDPATLQHARENVVKGED